MRLSDFFIQKLAIKRYSLKTVSIVVVMTLVLLCVAGCGKNVEQDVDGVAGISAVGDGSDTGTGSTESTGNFAENSNVEQIGGENASTTGIISGDASGDAAGVDLAQQPYGPYNPEVTINYLWENDSDEALMYLLTNPNINVALRGAGLVTDVSEMMGTTSVATVIVPVFMKAGDSVRFGKTDGVSRRYFFAQLDREKCLYISTFDSGWSDTTDEVVEVPYDTYVMVDYTFSNTNTEDSTDTITGKIMTEDKANVLTSQMVFNRNAAADIYEHLYDDNNALLDEVTITEGKSAQGNPYILIKIPSELSSGEQVLPNLMQTSWMEYYAYPTYDKLVDYDKKVLFRSVLSPLMYSQVYHTALTINAGLFNIFSNTPQGQTIIDGKVITNRPMMDDIGDPISPNTECYAMTIDAAGMLDYAKYENGAPYRTIDANELLAQGSMDVITGWGCIVYDGKSVVQLDASKVDSTTIFYEKVHRKKVAHQTIGQDRAGNYYILSTNDVDSGYGFGLNYDEAAEIMLAAGATFAYMLDGGDSVATVVGEKQLTTIYYEDYGKPVPTVINFTVR